METPLLATKFHIPPVHSTLVGRPVLVKRLSDGIDQGYRLTLVSAPAGYGKSTLLSEWISQIEIPVAWLSVEKGDNAPNRFWSYFVTALNSIPRLQQAGVGEEMLGSLQSFEPSPIDVLLANLVNDLTRLDKPIVMVLDDLHAITERQIHQDLVFLIDHLPRSMSGLHLVIASRMDPPWPLARWRGRDELNELRPSDLRFSYAETSQLLQQVLPLELSSPEVTVLQERTEGWIAGLQMASLSLLGRLNASGPQAVSGFIETFSGSNRFILDYLMEEVLSQQPAEIQAFLHETAILEQMTAALCDALTGRQDSQAILAQVERANLFLIPLDDERRWYRYHHLFAELLRKRLGEAHPERLPELHRRASDWYARNSLMADAISHALNAGDVARVNEFVSGNALAMLEQAELVDVLRHFEEIPEASICSRPWLCVAYAWVKTYVDPTGKVESILQQTETGLAGITNADERRRLLGHLAAIRSYIAWVQGDAVMGLKFAKEALEKLPYDDCATRAHVFNTQGSALSYLDDHEGAIESFEAAIVDGQKAGRLNETYFAYASLAFVNYIQGRLHQSYSFCQQVLNLAQKRLSIDETGQVSERLPVLAHAYATLSLVQLEWNDVDSAIVSARRAVALAERWKQADALHYSLTCLSKALCAADEMSEAFTVSNRSLQLGINVSNWFYRISVFLDIRLTLAKGDVALAARKFSELEPQVIEASREGAMVANVSLLFAQGRYPEVLPALARAIEFFKQRGQMNMVFVLSPLEALTLQVLDRQEEALESIRRCLVQAAPEGYMRIFLDHGAPMAGLLEAAARRGIEPEYIAKLLAAFNLPPSSSPTFKPSTFKPPSHSEPPTLVEPLTDRELQVLRLLDSPLTSEEIGRELYISANTSRTHIRNIYAKLGVSRRGEAVRRAKELQIM